MIFKNPGCFLVVSIFLTAGLVFPSPSSAGDNVEFPTGYTQEAFEDLSREVGLIVSYSPAAPAEPLGITGFDLGGEVSVHKIDADNAYWIEAIGGEKPPEYWAVPRLHAQKGLPFGIDIGAVWAKVPGSNIGLVGGELKYAFVKGNAVMPAMAIRGHYSTLLGVSDMDVDAYGGDFSISKGLGFLTPYAGIGQVWISSKETSDVPGLNLEKESLSEIKGFAGFKVRFFLVSFVAEASFSNTPSYIGRLNLSF